MIAEELPADAIAPALDPIRISTCASPKLSKGFSMANESVTLRERAQSPSAKTSPFSMVADAAKADPPLVRSSLYTKDEDRSPVVPVRLKLPFSMPIVLDKPAMFSIPMLVAMLPVPVPLFQDQSNPVSPSVKECLNRETVLSAPGMTNSETLAPGRTDPDRLSKDADADRVVDLPIPMDKPQVSDKASRIPSEEP
jgi:hypothetical protein